MIRSISFNEEFPISLFVILQTQDSDLHYQPPQWPFLLTWINFNPSMDK